MKKWQKISMVIAVSATATLLVVALFYKRSINNASNPNIDETYMPGCGWDDKLSGDCIDSRNSDNIPTKEEVEHILKGIIPIDGVSREKAIEFIDKEISWVKEAVESREEKKDNGYYSYKKKLERLEAVKNILSSN